MEANLNGTAMHDPQITPWQAHTLIELGGITGNILEFDQCQQIVSRLRTIATELDQLYGDELGRLSPSSRPEIRALHPGNQAPEDAIDFLYPAPPANA
jgi:hypothetical protein